MRRLLNSSSWRMTGLDTAMMRVRPFSIRFGAQFLALAGPTIWGQFSMILSSIESCPILYLVKIRSSTLANGRSVLGASPG